MVHPVDESDLNENSRGHALLQRAAPDFETMQPIRDGSDGRLHPYFDC